jgi:O-antigen/teichoic acid export membrane protein
MGFFTGIFAARMLGPHGRGELAAIQTAPSVIASFAMVGMAEALVYFSAREPDAAGRYLGTAVGVALVSCLPFMAAAYLAIPLLVHAQSPTIIRDARGYLLIAPLYATAGMLYQPLRSTGEYRAWNSVRVGVPVLALCVLAVAYMIDRVTPAFIAFGNLTTYAIVIVPSVWIVQRKIRGPFRPDLAQATPMLRYGFPCVMTGLPQMLNLRLDQMLMAAFLPPRDLGLYVVAVAWSGAVAPFLASVAFVLLPSVASAKDRDVATGIMMKGIRWTVMLAVLTSAITTAAAPFAIPFLFGAQFRDSIFASLILVPAAGLLGINFSLQECIRGFGRPYIVLRAELYGLFITAVMLTLMLRRFGIIGAAIASLLGYLTVTISMLMSAKEIGGISLASLVCFRSADVRSGIVHVTNLVRRNQ